MTKRTSTATKTKPQARALTQDEIKAVHRAAARVWDYIGADCLRALEESGEKAEMRRADVVELVLDAGRLDEELAKSKDQPGIKQAFAALDYKAQIRIVTKAFAFARYGW